MGFESDLGLERAGKSDELHVAEAESSGFKNPTKQLWTERLIIGVFAATAKFL